MNFEKKYLKYKKKYLELKNNISGGMIEVLQLPHETKTEITLKDVINLEYINLIKSYYNTQIENHIHKLLGFYDLESSKYYPIENIIINNKELRKPQIILNNINIEVKQIENELYNGLTLLSQINSIIISYIKENKHKLKYMNNIVNNDSIFEIDKCEIIVNFIKSEKKQTGGFNPKIICSRSKMNGFIKVYSEPVIEFINNFVFMIFRNYLYDGTDKHKIPIKDDHIYNYISNDISDEDLNIYYTNLYNLIYKKDTHGELKFVKIVFDKINFTQDKLRNKVYIKEILLEHLLNNKYAHNGIDNIDMLKYANNIITDSFTNEIETDNLVFLHSYLHYLDNLNMCNEAKLKEYYLSDDNKKELRSCFKKTVNIICFENILNQHQYDFLEKDTRGYMNPYRIKKEALPDKIRQYSNREGNDLFHNFYKQITKPEESIHPETETYITEPYGRYQYLKKYYNETYTDLIKFITTNEELNKITEINNSFKFSTIVDILNIQYTKDKHITKDDIIDLILIYLDNSNYIKEETL